MKFTRGFYIPKQYQKSEVGDLWAIYYTKSTINGIEKPSVMLFIGKRSKPEKSYYFKDEGSREDYINKFKARILSWDQNKKDKKKKREEFKHNLKVGDILYSSWGYEQTNIDFYQVTEVVSDKSVKIAQIGSKIIESPAWAEDYVIADKDRFIGKPFLKRVAEYGINLNSYSSAWKWDGNPKLRTSYA